MSDNKITIQISEKVFNELKERFEKDRLNYTALNINDTEQFIEYILRNFVVSSSEFDTLGESEKDLLKNIDFNNVDIKDLFRQVTESLAGNSNESENKNKNNNDKNNGNTSFSN